MAAGKNRRAKGRELIALNRFDGVHTQMEIRSDLRNCATLALTLLFQPLTGRSRRDR
jgi:hypothetical protein